MEEKDDSMIQSFEADFTNADLKGISTDILDAGIDIASNNDFIESIPIVKTLYGLYNLYKNIQAGRLAKKILKLIINTKDISQSDKSKFINDFGRVNKERGAEILLDVLTRLDNINKVDILSNLIKSKVREEITMQEFISLTSSLEKLPFVHIHSLLKYQDDYYEPGESDLINTTGLLYVSSISPMDPSRYKLSRYGYLLLKYGCLYTIDEPTDYKTNNSAIAVFG